MASNTPINARSRSSSLIGNLRSELLRALPFSQMRADHVDAFLAGASQVCFASGEVVLEPANGPVGALLCICQGSITGRHGLAETGGPFEYVAGDLFPVGAMLGQRAVSATYTANEDTCCLRLAADRVRHLAEASPPFADFLNGRVMQLLELSRRAMQAAWSSKTLAEQSLEARLASLPQRPPLAVHPATPLAQALERMHALRVGSVLVVDDAAVPLGILTRYDILGRVTLVQLPLDTPIGDVMTTPVHTLGVEHTLHDAALLMARHGVRHLPVTEHGKLVNIVSERDLFALQRLSLKHLSTELRGARDVATLQHLAGKIRQFAGNLLGQGVQARQLTELISDLNDRLTGRLLHLVAAQRGMDLSAACWLSFGSEGRGEQTVATDQDNGLVFASADAAADRPRWLALALEVNESLDRCGYPLCKGGVMASNPECCLTLDEWQQRFANWIEHGAPEDLLKASIYFDLRPLAGNVNLAQALHEMPAREAARVPRFLKQMAANLLRSQVPLNWRGALDSQRIDGREVLDIKRQGTALFVDAARLFALAQGSSALGTRARFEAAAPSMHVPAQESAAWVSAFEFLQMLRLQAQIGGATIDPTNPNLIDLDALNEIDRRMLKETMRIARRLQQRVELDYGR